MSDQGRFDVEEGQEVVRRTIVGGRPQARRAKTISVPIGIEKVLARAAGDAAFKHRLFDDRAAAVAEVSPDLQASEAAILRSVPDPILATMIGHIDLPRHAGRRFMKGVATAALASAALLSVDQCSGSSAGVTPDDVAEVTADVIDVEETAASRGILPDDVTVQVDPGPQSDGIRPDTVEE